MASYKIKELDMNTISVAEAKNRFSELLARVELGEEIAVTRHGKPVARLIAAQPFDAQAQKARVREALDRLAELRRSVVLEGDLKQIAREGLD